MNCPIIFLQVGRSTDGDKEKTFNLLCQWIDQKAEHGVFTLEFLHCKLQSFVDENDGTKDCYTRKYLKVKLLHQYKESIYFTNEERRADVLCFKDKCNQILRDYCKNEDLSLEQQKLELLAAAAKVLINDIKTIPINGKIYPTVKEMADDYDVPNSLTYFLSALLNSKKHVNVWAQNIVSALRPRSGPMPKQLGVALLLDHKFGSKHLIEQIHKLGYCSSYPEVLQYKWSYLKNKYFNHLEPIPEYVALEDFQIACSEDDEDEDVENEEVATDDEMDEEGEMEMMDQEIF